MSETIIQSPKWKIYLAATGALLFTAGGFFIVFADTSALEKIGGLLGVIFFGWFGGKKIYLMFKYGQEKIIISKYGLNLIDPFSYNHLFLRWEDIENFGVCKIRKQSFTTIRIKSYDNFIASIGIEEAKKMVSTYKSFEVIIDLATNPNVIPIHLNLLKAAPKSPDLKNLVTYLKYSRENFGGELLLGWNMRDRNASEFAIYLEKRKKESQ